MSNTYTKSNAFAGLGLIVAIGNNESQEVFTTVGEVRSFSGPDLKSETVDVTNVQSPGGVKEFLATLTDPGECDIPTNYVPDDPGQQAVYAACIAKTRMPFQITLPPSSCEVTGLTPGVWNLTALVTNLKIDIPLDKEATFTIKLKVSGLPTFTPAS